MGVLTTASGEKVDLPTNGEPLGLGAGPNCKIVRTQQGYLLKDLNGTYVNGQRVREHILREGDVIQFGSERYRFSAAAAPTGRATASAGKQTGATQKQPAAQPPAKTTQRAVGAAPATGTHKTGTQRIQKPATQSMGKPVTQSVPKPTTQSVPRPTTQSMQKHTTGRATRPITGRTTAHAVHAPKAPGSKKPLIFGVLAVLVLGGVGGLFWVINQSMDKPEDFKKEIKQRLVDFSKIPVEEVQRRHDTLADIVSNEKYKKYALADFNLASKALETVKAELKRTKEADDEVRPYLMKFNKAKDEKDYDGQGEALYDEVKGLIERHGQTHHEKKLTEVREELKKYLESLSSTSWISQYPKLQAETVSAVKKGDFAGALKLINDFGTQWKESKDAQLHTKMEDQRASMHRQAEQHVGKLERDAKAKIGEGKKDEAKKMLEDARPGFKDLPAADHLEKIIRELLR